MLLEDFDFALPPELIAQEPSPQRGDSRMLVVHRSQGRWEDRMFGDFSTYLHPGDCLILNNSRVLPSRLFGTRANGPAKLQVFLIECLSDDSRTWRALVRPGRKVTPGDHIRFSDRLEAEVLDWGDHGERTVRFNDVDVLPEIEQIGHIPLPPYIHREDDAEDRERYQTVFAKAPGSVAAPTAGLHFTADALQQCREAGAVTAEVTLHVGLGTFAPLRSEQVEENHLHEERFTIEPSALSEIQSASRRIAVGTTSVRTVESAYTQGNASGRTSIFIYPGYRFRAVNALLTNFHLPKSSLLLLVCALAGQELAMAAYAHAVEQRYRFFSYGDCMLIL